MTTQPKNESTPDTTLAAAPGTWPQAGEAWLGQSTPRRLRLVLGAVAVAALSTVAILSRPSPSNASQQPPANGAARLPSRHVPDYQLPTPSSTLIDAQGLAGHSNIPRPPEHDDAGRTNLGIIVGPALFVWVYGGNDGVRYTIADLQGRVLDQGLTASQVYGAFPEINLPEMQFGPDGSLCEPIMYAGDGL